VTRDTLARRRRIFMSHSWMHLNKSQHESEVNGSDVGWCHLIDFRLGHHPTMLCATLYRLDSDPSLSVFIMATCRTDLCRLGPQDAVSIEFNIAWHFWRDPDVIFVAMEIRETDSSPPSRLVVGCSPTLPPFVGAAILNSQLGSWLVRFFKAPPWIRRTIASIVLQTMAYCLSRLLIGYQWYRRAMLLMRLTSRI